MAKRKGREKKRPRDNPPQSPESLRKMADAIISSAGRLQKLADDIELSEFATLVLPNYDQLRRGMLYLDNFNAAGIRFLRKSQEERGDYRAGESNGVRSTENGHEK